MKLLGRHTGLIAVMALALIAQDRPKPEQLNVTPTEGLKAEDIKPRAPRARVPADECWTAQREGKLDLARTCFDKLTKSRNAFDIAEGFWGLEEFAAANEAFRTAHRANAKDAYLKVRWGRLFLERYNPDEAQNLFGEALELDPALPEANLGMAMVAAANFNAASHEYVKKALAADPTLVEAYEFRARIQLEDSKLDEARAAAEKALSLSPYALDAMAVLGTMDLLADKPSSEWFDKMLKANPHYGKGYSLAAYSHFINRRYEEAIELYRKAIELTPTLDAARSELGLNLMRLGREEEARKHLEQAYERGYRNAATVNTLRLMDSYANFVTSRNERFIVRAHKKEAALVTPYFEEQMRAAMDAYDAKYKLKLNAPVQVEVYPDHEDFAVRTMGMPGLGALGVTFGTIVVMDSPSARKPGQFHWASTLWHELSHVYTLTATKHRIPRWFTEGIAVHEETARDKTWGDRLDATIVGAIKAKKLLPIADLDRGFTRPSFPAQVIISYFQGGKTVDYIVERWGWDKVLAMLKDFSESRKTGDVIQAQLGVSPEQFDKDFNEWLDKKFGPQVRAFEDWMSGLKQARADLREKNYDDAIRKAQSIRDVFPEYVDDGSAYETLAEAYVAKGDKVAARKELERYADVGGRNPATLVQLAKYQAEAGDKARAVATIERLNLIDLRAEEPHLLCGEYALESGKADIAVREFRAAQAVNKTDPASRHYDVARALYAANRIKEAKDELFLALEAAPGYKPAQKLLLELEAKSGS